jgi:hypothetical protein
MPSKNIFISKLNDPKNLANWTFVYICEGPYA